MRHPTLVLVLMALACLSVGILVGWRWRISTEEVFTHPPEWQHLQPPDDLASTPRDPYIERLLVGWRETGGRA